MEAFNKNFLLTPTVRRAPYETILPTHPRNSKEGQILLVVGGGSGIGAAAAGIWARAGAMGIVLAGRRVDRLHDVASKLVMSDCGTRIACIAVDLASDTSVAVMFRAVQEQFGQMPDVILSTASPSALRGKVGDVLPDDWWKLLVRFKRSEMPTYAG